MNLDVPGPGGNPADITNTEQGGTGFDTENSNADIYGRVNGTVVEVAVDLSSIGLTPADLAMLDYGYLGTGRSNPSAPSDIFANDHFAPDFQGSEYDTLFIPEPSAGILAAIAGLAFLGRRQKRALR